MPKGAKFDHLIHTVEVFHLLQQQTIPWLINSGIFIVLLGSTEKRGMSLDAMDANKHHGYLRKIDPIFGFK